MVKFFICTISIQAKYHKAKKIKHSCSCIKYAHAHTSDAKIRNKYEI